MKSLAAVLMAPSVSLLAQSQPVSGAGGPVPLRDEQTFVTELHHVPEGWLAVGGLFLLAALGGAVIWMYRHEGRAGASKRLRTILAGVRVTVFLLLAVILLEPVRVRILHRWIDSYTVVLVDDSASMDLTDRYAEPQESGTGRPQAPRLMGDEPPEGIRRMNIVEKILNVDDRAFLRRLAAKNRVRFYTFSDEPALVGMIPAAREDQERAATFSSGGLRTDSSPRRAASDRADSMNERSAAAQHVFGVDEMPGRLPATGPATNIERAVRRGVESLGGAPVAACVVLSDGGFNDGASAEEVARFARERRIPVHVIGVGDPAPPRNVRVVEVLAPPNVFQEDPFAISARLAAEGLAGEVLEVELHESGGAGSGEAGPSRVVDRRTVRVGPSGTVDSVTFQQRQERVGRFVYSVRVVPLPDESVADDNSRQTTVNVIEARTRVLMVAGMPSWDYRFVSRLLTRDATFDVSCWLQSADYTAVRDGNTIIDHLPATAEELFEYDVILLMDPNPQMLDASWCRLVDTLVTEHGGGVLLTAARPFTPALMRDRALEDLHALLPVTPDPEADLILNEIGHYQSSPSPIDVPSTALGHPIMKLGADTAGTKLAWRGIGEIYWHYPVLREKPLATVLMRHGDPKMRNAYGEHVLAAVQFVGAGRTGFLGFDGTWRWREHGVELFDRFWVQFLRYLAEGKLLTGAKRGMLLTEADEYALGETVTVTARLFDAQYKPLRRDQVPAQYVVDGQKSELMLTARPETEGWFEGRFVPDRTGSFEISLKLPSSSAAEPLEVSREVRVSRPNLEIARPQMDRAKLVALAEDSDGGAYFDVDDAEEVPARIADLHEEIPIRSRPSSLWDNWVTLTVLLALLTFEWSLRKWNRLL